MWAEVLCCGDTLGVLWPGICASFSKASLLDKVFTPPFPSAVFTCLPPYTGTLAAIDPAPLVFFPSLSLISSLFPSTAGKPFPKDTTSRTCFSSSRPLCTSAVFPVADALGPCSSSRAHLSGDFNCAQTVLNPFPFSIICLSFLCLSFFIFKVGTIVPASQAWVS